LSFSQFITEIVSSLAWPAVVVWLAYYFRKPMAELLRRLSRAKYKDLELDFERLRESSAVVESYNLQKPKGPSKQSPIEEQTLLMTKEAPSGSILLSWAIVTGTLAAAVERVTGKEAALTAPAGRNINELQKAEKLSREVGEILNDMRVLRNQVAHNPDAMLSVTKGQADLYAKSAIELVEILNGLE